MKDKPKRLMSLDALRGFDMIWIIGGERVIHAWSKASDNQVLHGLSEQFRHVPWDGFRFYDLIFPLFIFMAGVSMPFAITSKVEKGVDKRHPQATALIFSKVLCQMLAFSKVLRQILDESL